MSKDVPLLRRATEYAAHFVLLSLLLLLASPLSAFDLPLRWRWSNPAPHGANIFDSTSNFGLTLAVGERGQIFTSDDLLLWQPRKSPTTRSLRGITFYGQRVIIAGESGTILHADSLDEFQLLDLQTPDWLEGVAASPQRVVAVGDNGAIYSSTNGLDWSRQSTPISQWLRAVAYGSGTFILVGENGLIATSATGLSWTLRPSGTSAHLNKIAWHGNRPWIVGDNGTVLTSQSGGNNWTIVAAGATNDLYAANAHSTGGLAAGLREVRLRNPDGSWLNALDPSSASPPPAWTYFNALWLDSFHFLAGRSGLMVEGFQTNSQSPFVWVNRIPSMRNWLWDLQRTPGFYIAVGYNGTIMTSVDGIDWDLELIPQSATNTVLLGVGGDTNLLLAVGDNGAILTSPNTLANIVSPGPNNTSTTNVIGTLGIFWHDQPRPTTEDLQGITSFQNSFVVTGSAGTVLTSPDGTNWTSHPTPTTAYLSSVASHNDTLVAVGRAGTIISSPDGRSWTLRSSGTTNWIYRVRHLAGQLVAVGQNGTLLVSADAINWSSRPTGTGAWLNDITLVDQTYIAVGTQGTVLASSNLVDWISLGTLTQKSLYGVACHDGQLLVAGVEGTLIRSQLTPIRSPVEIERFSRTDNQNLFLFSGHPDQQFTLETSHAFPTWHPAYQLEFLDSSGTLLLLEGPTTNPPPIQFFRTALTP